MVLLVLVKRVAMRGVARRETPRKKQGPGDHRHEVRPEDVRAFGRVEPQPKAVAGSIQAHRKQ